MIKSLYTLGLTTLLVGCSTLEPPPVHSDVTQPVEQAITYNDILDDFLFAYDETQGDIDALYESMADLSPEWQYRLMLVARDISGDNQAKCHRIDDYLNEIKKSLTAENESIVNAI